LFSGVHELRGNLKTPFHFPAVKLGLILENEAEQYLTECFQGLKAIWWFLFHKDVKS
jgi:hypothetical protein